MPIGLLNSVSNGAGVTSPVAGWLFVSRGDSVKHYCSNCRAVYLNSIANAPLPSRKMETSVSNVMPEPE